jgi:hypothetical protein
MKEVRLSDFGGAEDDRTSARNRDREGGYQWEK